MIGAGQGGLSAAIEARLDGHDVTVYEARDAIGGKAAPATVARFRLDQGPSIVILPELYRPTFARAGKRMEDYLSFRKLPEITRVVMEGESPIDLPNDRAACLDLVRSLDADDAKSLDTLLAKLDGTVQGVTDTIFAKPFERWTQLLDWRLIKFGLRFDVRKTYKETIDGWFRHPLLRAFFYGFPSYGGQSYHAKAPGALTIPYFMLSDGVYWPAGPDGEGIAAIPAAFARLAQDLGVLIECGQRVEGVRRDGARVTHVTVNGRDEPFDAVISNRDRFASSAWLGEPESREPSYSYYTLHWGERVRREGLKHHTLLVPKGFERGFDALYERREFPDPPIVYLNDTTATDPTVAPMGATNLFAVVTCPSKEPHLDWNDPAPFRAAVARTMAACGQPMPTDVAFERIQTPETFESRDGSYRGSLYGLDERHRILGGSFPLGVRDESIRNLFYCGGAVQPGAGLPMVTLSGRFAAAALRGC